MRLTELLTRSLRPPDDITPNSNDPAMVPPSTVGPDQLVNPGDPEGVVLDVGPGVSSVPPTTILPSPWSGWPADWWTPAWQSTSLSSLTDTAWMCLDLNSSVLASMPPYLVGAAPTIDAGWMTNPDPETYSSWDEFCRSMFWDYMAVGEAFVLATARYSTGWPARFHVLPPWTVDIEMRQGRRTYTVGSANVTDDLLHIRYQSSVDNAHGQGPLEAGRARLVQAEVLSRYATNLFAGGGIPPAILHHKELLSDEQAAALKAQWIAARASAIGEPAVLDGGIEFETTAVNPKDMALVELAQFNESRIAVLLGVPPFLVGLPSGGDSMTYSNTTALFDYHWRAGLRPKASAVMAAMSGWALPRGTTVELNRDAYVQPGPYERAQTEQILVGIGAMSVDEVREVERLTETTTATEAALMSAPIVP